MTKLGDLSGAARRVRRAEARLGWALAMPALGVIGLVAVFPILWTFWESLHLHDLRMPWLGRPFVGVANYVEALADQRFWSAFAHTAVFVAVTVAVELAGGLLLALALDRVSRARELVRTAVLLPWAIPTVVAALVWRFMFESPAGSPLPCSRGSGWRRRHGSPTRSRPGFRSCSPTRGRPRRLLRCCCWPGCSKSIDRCTKRQTWTAPGPGGSSSMSRCRCCGRHCWWRSSSARSTPFGCSTSCS